MRRTNRENVRAKKEEEVGEKGEEQREVVVKRKKEELKTYCLPCSPR